MGSRGFLDEIDQIILGDGNEGLEEGPLEPEALGAGLDPSPKSAVLIASSADLQVQCERRSSLLNFLVTGLRLALRHERNGTG
jgi:hypothetical protein